MYFLYFSSFLIVTRLRTWGSWFESRWGQDIFLFSKTSRPVPGPTQPCIQRVSVFVPGGQSRRDMELTTSLHLVRRLRMIETPYVDSDKLTFKFFSRYSFHFCSLKLRVLSLLYLFSSPLTSINSSFRLPHNVPSFFHFSPLQSSHIHLTHFFHYSGYLCSKHYSLFRLKYMSIYGHIIA